MSNLHSPTPWSTDIENLKSLLATDIKNGLEENEVQTRQKKFGENIFSKKADPSWAVVLLRQFYSPLIIILVIATLITVYLQEWIDAVVISLAVLINAGLGFYQEWKAEKSIADLRSYIIDRTRVLRAGSIQEIDTKKLVPGDILYIKQNSRVPADARIFSQRDLAIDESLLTGESTSVHKTDDIFPDSTPLAERKNMLFAGTVVTKGTAYAIVTATGANTEIGKIANLVETTTAEKTPLQKAITQLTWAIVIITTFIVGLVFYIGIQNGISTYEMLMLSIAVLVGSIPEALPIGLTAVLALGMQRIAKAGGVIRNLTAAETLGSTDVIITDKTGTLTEADMQLRQIYNHNLDTKITLSEKRDNSLAPALEVIACAANNTDVVIENPAESATEWKINGDPLESSIIKVAGELNIFSETSPYTRTTAVLPFDSSHKFSVFKTNTKLAKSLKNNSESYCILGAPDVILDRSDITKDEYLRLKKEIEKASFDGYRILGVAHMSSKNTRKNSSSASDFSSFTLLGFLYFQDPIREEVPTAIKDIERHGVRVIISTGDLKGTAMAVARSLGWNINNASVLTGAEIQQLNDEELTQSFKHVRIFARVTPEDKLRITKLLQKQGHVVAMTGDGVNDAPSLKSASIGVAIGSGNDVTKSVADLVLLNDSFSIIVNAIEEGKGMLRNIKKIFVYLVSSSLDEIFLIGGSIIAGLALPLTALQIIWINLFTNSVPALAFAFAHSDYNLIKQKESKRVLDARVIFLTLSTGISISLFLFLLYYFSTSFLEQHVAQTFIFTCFAAYSLVIAFSFKEIDLPLFKYPLFDNKLLLVGVIGGLVALLSTLYLPLLQTVFGTLPLSPWLLLFAVIWCLFTVAWIEFMKWIFNSYSKKLKKYIPLLSRS